MSSLNRHRPSWRHSLCQPADGFHPGVGPPVHRGNGNTVGDTRQDNNHTDRSTQPTQQRIAGPIPEIRQHPGPQHCEWRRQHDKIADVFGLEITHDHEIHEDKTSQQEIWVPARRQRIETTADGRDFEADTKAGRKQIEQLEQIGGCTGVVQRAPHEHRPVVQQGTVEDVPVIGGTEVVEWSQPGRWHQEGENQQGGCQSQKDRDVDANAGKSLACTSAP